jgi:glycosyltransferase involved in cell wall biosynthesis
VPENVPIAPKISVIIPVYNTAPYLRRCLDSVCGQTLRDIEIICVNDGSTDGSADILRECAEKDNRVMLITLPVNGGAAAARNRGMDAARGEYLGFVDSDDWPYPDFYAKLFEAACENNADVAKGNYRYWGLDGRSLPVGYWMNDEIRKHKTSFSFAFCSAVYRRELVAAHAVLFPEDQVDIEDPIFSLKIALCCNGIAIVDDAEINIVINRDSATYSAPDIQKIYAKFSGLSKLLDVMNNDNSIVEDSYAFVAAFWFKSVTTASVRNTSERAFRVIREELEMVFTKVSHRDACSAAFKERGSADLFSALAKGDTAKLSAYLMRFYDKKTFAAAYLKAKLHKKPQGAGKACVVIPLYAEQPRPLERASLRQCLSILGKHRIVFFGPESLNTAAYDSIAREYGVACSVERFPDAYFTSPFSYSKLLLNVDFYCRFTHSEYMLVHQLDCWVFRDELVQWCSKGYDYIGAPQFAGYSGSDAGSPFLEPSGNGGFSLRGIAVFIRCLCAMQMKMIAGELDDLHIRSGENEDRLLVRVFPKVDPDFAVAPVGRAMRFSFEVQPERLYALTGKLPFGCHAYAKYDPEFWTRHIPVMEGTCSPARTRHNTVAVLPE